MGTVYKKTVTKALPPSAEIIERNGQRVARWRIKGKLRTAPLTDNGRIVIKSTTFTAKYRDGSGQIQEVATGCKDETAAKQVLASLEKRADGVRSGMRSAAEDSVVDHLATPIGQHFEAYREHQRMKGVHSERIKSNQSRLKRIAADCGFNTLADLEAGKFENWLDQQAAKNMSPGNRNGYRESLVGFCNWCRKPSVGRLLTNPFSDVPKADAKADQRRKRRSMTESELTKLLEVARQRPLNERLTIRRGKRKGQLIAKISDEVRNRLEREGWERALIYKTLVLTGLRKGELASLTVGQLEFDGPVPFAQLAAADEKNREGNAIALRADLVDDLQAWLADKLMRLQEVARQKGEAAPERLPINTKLFTVPAGLLRILNRDLKAAGIPKKDERGRTLDIHALRHSFGTLLSKGNVAPRTAQAAMRHSSIDLTMNVYTDPKLLDVHGALNALPALPLSCDPLRSEVQTEPQKFAPRFAPNPENCSELGLTADKIGDLGNAIFVAQDFWPENTKGLPVITYGKPFEVGATRFELATSTSRT